MANTTTNIMTLKGDPDQIKKVREWIRGERGEIDFNRIIPKPPELQNNNGEEGIGVESDIAVREYIESLPFFARRNDAIQWYSDRHSRSDLNGDEKRLAQVDYHRKCLELYGYPDSLKFDYDQWGVKWGPYGVEAIDSNVIKFETANGTPRKVMTALSGLFPEVDVFVEFASEDFGYGVGAYLCSKGNIELTNLSDTLEGRQLACRLLEYDEETLLDCGFDSDLNPIPEESAA